MNIQYLLGALIIILLIFFEPITNGLMFFGIWGAIIPLVFCGLVPLIALFMCRENGMSDWDE